MLTQAKKDQARIIGQIQKSYNNAGSLLNPTINQIEFEKAIKKDNTPFFFEDVIKSFASTQLKAIDLEKDETLKTEMIQKSSTEIASLEKIDIVFDNMIKGIYVDVIDLETKTYKDNEINRLLDRVGNPTK
jgi:hypothetical protein